MSWKTKSSKEVYRNKWMTLYEDKVIVENGDEFTWSVVRKKDCALVIPWDGEYFTIVGLYRYPTDKFSWEFPAGHMEGNDILETAHNELEEETGLKAGKFEEIGNFYLANGFLDQRCYVFLATDLKEGELNRESDEEDMKIKRVKMNELENMIMKGEIKDGPTITALTFFKIWRENK
jgi:8-oxo-dGTP pyrophosphatase MutT (NUDIX family)